MKIECQLKMGQADYKFIIDEKEDMEALHKAIVLTNPRHKCNVCGNTEGLYFASNKDKEGNTYVNVVCPKCGAKSKLGRYKTGGYFWREFSRYQPDDKRVDILTGRER